MTAQFDSNPQPSTPANRARLTSWKEIAAYFGREVRTVQRWEKEEGMPIHRHLHLRKGSVYAVPDELDAWWHQHASRAALCDDETHNVTNLEAPASPIGLPGWTRLVRWPHYSLVSAAVLLLLLAVGWHWWRLNRDRLPAHDAASFAPATLQISGSNVGIGTLGDLNGDGHDDVVLGTLPGSAVFVRFGGQQFSANISFQEGAHVQILSDGSGDLIPVKVADVNADGIGDLLISEELREPASFQHTGSSYILFGRKTWPRQIKVRAEADVVLEVPSFGDIRMGGCTPNSRQPQDLNADGIDDVILGAADYSEQGRASAGGLFVLFGRARWNRVMQIPADADIRILGSRTGEGLSAGCAVGDFNGDGRADLAVLANEGTLFGQLGGLGRLYVFFGPKSWPPKLDAGKDFSFRVDGQRNAARLGVPLLADVNADGSDDLIASWFDDGSSAASAGALGIWFGGANRRGTLPATAADVRIQQAKHPQDCSAAYASADVDGDSIQDVLVTDPGRGQINVLYGRSQWRPQGGFDDLQAVALVQRGSSLCADRIAWGDTDGDTLPEMMTTEYLDRNSPRVAHLWTLPRIAKLDVRPGATPNILYYPNGLLVVRVFNGSASAGHQIDPASLRLAGVAPSNFTESDFDADGIPDLQAIFSTAQMRVTPETHYVTLTGRTRSGLPIAGRDTVVVVRRPAPPETKSANAIP